MLHDGGGEAVSVSRVSGHCKIDRAIELHMAGLLETEDAALTMSGHHACLGLMALLCALGTPGTPVFRVP